MLREREDRERGRSKRKESREEGGRGGCITQGSAR